MWHGRPNAHGLARVHPLGARWGATARPTRRWLIHRCSQRSPFDDLDAGPPGIRDVRYGAAGRRLAHRLVELDAFRLDLLHEGGVVLHVKADVIEDAPAGRGLWRVSLGEPQLHARDAVHHRRVVAGADLAAERLGVPGL